MDHTILKKAFPFIFDAANLVVGAEHDISLALSTLFSIIFSLGV